MGNPVGTKCSKAAVENLAEKHLRSKLGLDFFSVQHTVSGVYHWDYGIRRSSNNIVSYWTGMVQAIAAFATCLLIIIDGNGLPGKENTKKKRENRSIDALFAEVESVFQQHGAQLNPDSLEGKAMTKLSKQIANTIPKALVDEIVQAIRALNLPNVQVFYAACEADHQLLYYVAQGDVDLIIGNDTDFLMNGGNGLITGFGWDPNRKVLRGKVLTMQNILATAEILHEMEESEAGALVRKHYKGNKGARGRCWYKIRICYACARGVSRARAWVCVGIDKDTHLSLAFFALMREFGQHALLDLAIFTGNDYKKVPNVGPQHAIEIITAVLHAFLSCCVRL